jgi:hypothetical protein
MNFFLYSLFLLLNLNIAFAGVNESELSIPINVGDFGPFPFEEYLSSSRSRDIEIERLESEIDIQNLRKMQFESHKESEIKKKKAEINFARKHKKLKCLMDNDLSEECQNLIRKDSTDQRRDRNTNEYSLLYKVKKDTPAYKSRMNCLMSQKTSEECDKIIKI